MQIQSITAQVKQGDPGPGDVRPEFAEVTIDLGDDREVTFVIHQSKAHKDCINVEIDGDLTANDPTLRLHLNDHLIFDSILNLPAVEPDREADLEPED